MKVLLINGSPKADGVCALALEVFASVLREEGIEAETVQVGNRNVPGCKACSFCLKGEGCVYHDLVDDVARKLDEAAGIVVASPVYYASPNGTLVSFLDRLFYSSRRIDKRMKVGCSIVSCRRGGASATFDMLNKYFTISEMPIVSSRYWNSIHGNTAEEARQDAEGLQTMRTLARNMAFLVKAIQSQKEREGLPPSEPKAMTNFIR